MSSSKSPWPEDPWEWTIDQVVTAFCDQTYLFRATNNPQALPDATSLERKLREHCIEGCSLLNDINHASLKEDFDILALGQRGHILREIERLRGGSRRYLEYIQNRLPEPSSGCCTIRHDATSPYPRLSIPPRALASPLSAPAQLKIHSTINTGTAIPPASATSHDEEHLARPESAFEHSQKWLDQLPNVSGPLSVGGVPESTDELENPLKQRNESEAPHVPELCPHKASTAHEPSHSASQSALPDAGSSPAEELAAIQILPPQIETFIIDKNGNKRRRLVLTTAAPTNLEDRADSTAVNTKACDEYYEQSPATLDGSPVSVKAPNVGELMELASKEIYQANEQQESSIASATKIGEIAKVPPTDVNLEPLPSGQPWKPYLGTRASHVDDIFYERVQLGPKLSSSLAARTISNDDDGGSDDFVFSSISVGDGQRQYVKSRIHYFLRQKIEKVRRGKEHCLGLRPYPDRLGPKQQPLSITIFQSTSDGVFATRGNRAEWLLDDPSGVGTTNQRSCHPDVDVFSVPVSLKEVNEGNWDYLEKWNYASENGTVLPIYGESGSEGEYDLDTWRQIEKERGGNIPRPLGRSKQMRKLGVEEVLRAIEETSQSMVEDWKRKRLPQLLRTAWILWSKSRRDRTKQVQISSLSSDVQYLNRRLDKLRKEIASEKWVSTARVTRQCESLRRTIYELEDSNWKIATLQLKARPEKPQKLRTAQSKKPGDSETLVEDQDGGADTSIVETSAAEELDDFIVDDEDPATAGDNASMMDAAEDDDAANDEGLVTGIADSIREEAPFEIKDIEVDKLTPKTPKQEPSSRLKTRPLGPVDIIDLTLDSYASESEVPLTTTTPPTNTKTPAMPPAPFDEDPLERSQRKKALFKVPPGVTDDVDQDNDSAYDSLSERTTPPKLPALHEWTKISSMDPQLLMERADRKRLLIYVLTRVDLLRRKNAYTYISNHDLSSAQEGIWRSIKSIIGFRSIVLGTQSKKESRTLKNITAWFIYWTNAVIIKGENGANLEYFEVAASDKEGFESFYNFLHELRCLIDFEKPETPSKTGGQGNTFDHGASLVTSPTKSETTPTKQKRTLIAYSDNDEHQASARKKRKYEVPESQEAAGLRKKAHERVLEREERQRSLKQTLQKMGQTEDDPSQVAVNLGKLDDQELIYLPASIGARIQPHQKEGVRFLWREIIEDHASKQGCLLAQTMGLGKTMQVISFLVTVAEAALSPNANIRSQIPPRLRESKTLVLCPPSLIENWYEEFLIWAPDDMAESIGDIRKVSASMAPHERLQTIEEWGDEGGILLLGYSVLRELIDNPVKAKTGQAPLDSDQHRMMMDILLGRPNIVIADEAHMAKNRRSKLYQVLVRFSSGSRIALTGSPLSNNLSEYYSLIEWVAPGYLGEHREFLAHYEEPIQEGLYRDSPAWKWRIGLKKLELFKREVQPKVHRADISVLASHLKGKSEFVIKVPLTPLQEEIYQIFVESMDKQYKGTEGPQQTTLWALISILRLVCNHPKCFHDKLMNKESAKTKKKGRRKERPSMAEELGVADEDEALVDASPLELGMSDEVVQRQLKPLKDREGELDSISLAYKMKLLLQIIELSKAAGDKILVFSHSLLTLDYVGHILSKEHLQHSRMDGLVPTACRQRMTKTFNEGLVDIFLVSTRAGGTGLNLFGANRVVIIDDHWNPTWEEQAVGRAYRIGQTKHVFVYRLTTGGTFEEALHNQSLFKQQLATRAVDKRNTARLALRSADYFQPLRVVAQEDLEPFKGKDPDVLDKILAWQTEYGSLSGNMESQLTMSSDCFIRDIVPCETFQQEVEEKLTAEEQREVELEEELSRLRRTDLAAYQIKRMELSSHPKTSPSLHPRVPTESISPRPINPSLLNLPPYPAIHGRPFGSQPVNPNTHKPPLGAANLSKTTGSLGNPSSQGVKVSNTAPVLANSSFSSQLNTFPRMCASMPRQKQPAAESTKSPC
ncbi:MAG: hypothetical protein Q9225_004426 [Loekoesia sp. 1 TL-2023]